MKIIDRIKAAFLGERWLAYEQMEQKYRVMFRQPVYQNEDLQKIWDRPDSLRTSLGRIALLNRVLVIDNGKPMWTAGVRLMGRNAIKKPAIWMQQERLEARTFLDKAFENVGDHQKKEYFYSVFAAHVKVPLTEEELIDFCKYHRSTFDAVEKDGKLTLSLRGSGTPVSAG